MCLCVFKLRNSQRIYINLKSMLIQQCKFTVFERCFLNHLKFYRQCISQLYPTQEARCSPYSITMLGHKSPLIYLQQFSVHYYHRNASRFLKPPQLLLPLIPYHPHHHPTPLVLTQHVAIVHFFLLPPTAIFNT